MKKCLWFFGSLAGIFLCAELISFAINTAIFQISKKPPEQLPGQMGVLASQRRAAPDPDEYFLKDVQTLVRKKKNIAWDPNLGYRHTASSRTHTIVPDESGRPVYGPNFFVNQYGMISTRSRFKENINLAKASESPQILRVLISGASSTFWGASGNEKAFPAVLERLLNRPDSKLKKKYKRILVINSSVSGLDVSQQLRRYTDETYYLNPQFVISYVSPNRFLVDEKINPVDYSLHKHQKSLVLLAHMNNLSHKLPLLPNLMTLIDHLFASQASRQQLGFRHSQFVQMQSIDLFLSKISQFHDLASGAGSRYLWLLPPNMARCRPQLTPDEQTAKKYYGETFYKQSWQDHVEEVGAIYGAVRKKMNLPWQVDIGCLFEKVDETVYRDPQHYNDLGHELVARTVYAELLKRID